LTKEQFKRLKNPELFNDEEGEDEDLGSLHHSSKSSFRPVGGPVTVSPNASLSIEVGDDDDLLSLKDGRRSESPTNRHGGSPCNLSTSPALLRRAEAEEKKLMGMATAKASHLKLVEEKESGLREIRVGEIKPPVLGKLPPARARGKREEMKKLASDFTLRSRPKSATGQSNSSFTSQKLARAIEFNSRDGGHFGSGVGGSLERPSTSAGH